MVAHDLEFYVSNTSKTALSLPSCSSARHITTITIDNHTSSKKLNFDWIFFLDISFFTGSHPKTQNTFQITKEMRCHNKSQYKSYFTCVNNKWCIKKCFRLQRLPEKALPASTYWIIHLLYTKRTSTLSYTCSNRPLLMKSWLLGFVLILCQYIFRFLLIYIDCDLCRWV